MVYEVHKLIVTLTTISSRLDRVHVVIRSLLAQDFPSHSYQVRLHLSKKPYMLDQGCPKLTEELKQLQVDNPRRFYIQYVENTGPYRKIIPVLNEVYGYSPADFFNTLIITADDDTEYPPFFLSRLYEKYLEHQCIIGFRGRSIRFESETIEPYKSWTKTIKDNPSIFNVPTGKDGVLYSPHHFNPGILDIVLAKKYAPKADDLWIKVHTLLAGMESFIIHDSLDQSFPSVTGGESAVSLYNSFNKNGGNDMAIQDINLYLVQKFGLSIHDLIMKKYSKLLTALVDQLQSTSETH